MRVKSPSRTTPPDDAPLTTQKKSQCHHAPNPKQHSVIEIERIISAGRFHDADPGDLEEEEEDAKFDISMLNFQGKFEGHCRKRFARASLRQSDSIILSRSVSLSCSVSVSLAYLHSTGTPPQHSASLTPSFSLAQSFTTHRTLHLPHSVPYSLSLNRSQLIAPILCLTHSFCPSFSLTASVSLAHSLKAQFHRLTVTNTITARLTVSNTLTAGSHCSLFSLGS
ncbi:hypothetical protein TorRG33x02_113980 [Trema orientale]|uniref:Uncharacterized protein n=1 Tax=Trema orientale TaxID=63057 RepID=A0A2P5F4S6_TREOI|nr:hypothetical protein TorRG33x02_113980 [Trema orientale]